MCHFSAKCETCEYRFGSGSGEKWQKLVMKAQEALLKQKERVDFFALMT
jgi:hypothetical protein